MTSLAHPTGDEPDAVRSGATSRAGRRQARESQIVDTAAQLFAANGYAGAGMASLCDATGMGRGALYHYIDAKQDLLAMIHDRVIDELLEQVDQIRAQELCPAEALRRLGATLIGVITQYPDHVWVFLHERRQLTGDHAADFRRKRSRWEQAVEEFLQAGMATGEFRVGDLRLTALAWHNLHNYTYQWVRSEKDLDPLRLAGHLHEIFLHGITPTPTAMAERQKALT